MLRRAIQCFAFLVCMTVFSTCGALSQQQKQAAPSQPTTKMEEFSARTGIVIVRGFSTIGLVAGHSSGQLGTIRVEAREFRDASNPNTRLYGLAFTVKESGQLERENISYVDYDEIDSLLRGIDYVAKTDKAVTPMNDFEAEYRTKADFSIITFSNRDKIEVAVASGRIGKTQVFLNLSQLSQLRSLVQDGKSAIETAMKTPSK
jgi:hypothetical protein